MHARAAVRQPAGETTLVQVPLWNRHRQSADLRKTNHGANVRITLAEIQHLHAPVTPVAFRSRAGAIDRRYPASGFHPGDTRKAAMKARRASVTRSKYK